MKGIPKLDVRDLQVVLVLAREGTTARASEVLHLTQPAVSRALASVENKLGVRLFDRGPRGLAATAACERLVEGAPRVLAELVDLERRVVTPATPVRVRLVCQCYTAYHWLPSVLLGLRRGLPGLQVKLAVHHTVDPVGALEAGDIDVALLTTGEPSHPSVAHAPLFEDEIVFVVADTHRLAKKRTLTREDLAEETLVTSPTPAAEARWFMKHAFGRKKLQLQFERFPLTEAIIDVTRAGLGVAILSEWIAAPHIERGGLVVKRLASGPLRRPWRIAWRHDHAVAAERLRAALAATVPSARLAS
jgi:LysR family transcriptional regulator for metE and metH